MTLNKQTLYLRTNIKTIFTSKFNITVDVNSLTVSLLQTEENDYQSGTLNFRFKTILLTSTSEGTISTLETTTKSNAENATTSGKYIFISFASQVVK